jgi:hypothetical protein
MPQAPTQDPIDRLAERGRASHPSPAPLPQEPHRIVVVRTQTRRSWGPPIDTRRQCPARWCSRGDACVPAETPAVVSLGRSPIGHRSCATTITRLLSSRCTVPTTKTCWPTPSASAAPAIDRLTTTRWRSRNAPSPPAVTTSTDANDDPWSHSGRTATRPMRHTALTLTGSA